MPLSVSPIYRIPLSHACQVCSNVFGAVKQMFFLVQGRRWLNFPLAKSITVANTMNAMGLVIKLIRDTRVNLFCK